MDTNTSTEWSLAQQFKKDEILLLANPYQLECMTKPLSLSFMAVMITAKTFWTLFKIRGDLSASKS